MGDQSGPSARGTESTTPPQRDSPGDFHRLSAALIRSARRLGSRDPESAAQEALKRSLENRNSNPAVKYYFVPELPPGAPPPEWGLDQLLAWLHAVVYYVVREERSRAAYKRELPLSGTSAQPSDPAVDQLETLIGGELRHIMKECFLALDREHRAVLQLRADGLKYKEIGWRIGVNENTVATWISRGIQALGRCARRKSSAREIGRRTK